MTEFVLKYLLRQIKTGFRNEMLPTYTFFFVAPSPAFYTFAI